MPLADARDLPKDRAGETAAALVAKRRHAPSVEAAQAEGSLVLIAEDHPTNRTLLERLLKLLGYAAVAASNGREALELWRSGRFAMVLTDCNMPEMDGYALARAIRAEEKSGARVPIVACTANASAEDAAECIEAGMDDFLAKPVELEALAGVLDRWLPLSDAARRQLPAPGAKAGPLDDAPLDRSSLAQVSGGDAAMEREILADFRSANDADIAGLRAALAARDLAKVVSYAHRVKGACRTVGASALAAVCERMEAAGRRNDWSAVSEQRARLDEEFVRLSAWLVAA